jgi:transcription elongation factor Elf1
MTETLRECPFCNSLNVIGGSDQVGMHSWTYHFTCRDCGTVGPDYAATPTEAITLWNTRKETPHDPTQEERL